MFLHGFDDLKLDSINSLTNFTGHLREASIFTSALFLCLSSLLTSELNLKTGVGRLSVAESGGYRSPGRIVGAPARGSPF